MKKLILLFTIALTSQLCTAQIAPDKIFHFAGGAFISAATTAVVYETTGNKKKAYIWGTVMATLAGIGKEAYDEHTYGGWDNKDLGATILGGLTVSLTFNILDN
jgi:putative lipoprotein